MQALISNPIKKLAVAIAKKDLKEKIIDLFRKNPNPSDDTVHNWAEKNGYNIHRVESVIYELVTEHIKKHLSKEAASKKNLKGFVTNIEKDTVENKKFRKVLYTGKHSQLVLMTLKPGEDIGEEVHTDVDQFFRIDEGSGKVVINGKNHSITDGSAFIIPAGAKHNVIASDKGLKLYSVYSPPNHKDKTTHNTKEEAESSEEHFDGETTE